MAELRDLDVPHVLRVSRISRIEIYPGTYAGGLARRPGCAPGRFAARGPRGLAAEAGRGDAPQAAGRKAARSGWRHLPWLWRRLSFGWRLVLRNVFRNRLRTAVGMFATAMGAGLLVCGFILASAITYLIDFQFQLVTHSDVDLRFKDERGLAALLEARRLPGVDYAEPMFDVSCTFINGPHRRRGAISGLMPDSRLTMPRDIERAADSHSRRRAWP